MFNLIFRVLKFVVEAVYTYAASDEGRAELIDIANDAEADGIDIPFYEPSSSDAGRFEADREAIEHSATAQSSPDRPKNPYRRGQ